ncbi:uncharacterized protein EDB91DRAFT_1047018 [Suillus paluster]|uniref:uncharacterized protein n=1 Tax=Suillus paluster TaxID=48578 RepID=UPI001B85F0A1|nr:uncharacterized protein EDB91DRAFT_1047018 [Suillus paluster]KAG1749856.1 hypothetical protein EDB91DRAFT_1047018 [Suillus paluster]
MIPPATGKAPMHPLLAKYLKQLATNPLRTKALTSGTFSFLQEVIGSNVAGLPPPQISKNAAPLTKALARARIDSKAIKMAMYGFFVSAPMGHLLVGLLQKAFAGKTGLKARLGQLLASNLLIAPLNAAVFLASMAIINGAKSFDEVIRTVKGGFFSVVRVSWMVSPISMTIAQQFIPVELWVPFFNTIQFTVGTFLNIKVKKLRLAAIRKEAEERERERARKATEEVA